jgi:hypothetical protein
MSIYIKGNFHLTSGDLMQITLCLYSLKSYVLPLIVWYLSKTLHTLKNKSRKVA